jgi:hypothetical protein
MWLSRKMADEALNNQQCGFDVLCVPFSMSCYFQCFFVSAGMYDPAFLSIYLFV